MAKVLSSISGNLISAASAGYAPTNSADVSAIASAYQVVSATATQLYAGTAFLTEVNGANVSASRAGQAANASMANSAYYDGTGRLISALPDSAAVSSIASSYAESAASSKADSSSLSSYALSSDVSGVIDTVSSNSASWASGVSLPITGSAGDDTASYEAGRLEFTRYDTAGEPDIRTASLSPDQFYLDYTLDGNDHTSMMLTESMLDFGDSDGDHIVDAYSIDSWNSAVDTVANNSASWGGGGAQVVTATGSATATAHTGGFWPVTAYLVSSINGSAILPYGFSSLSANSANWNSVYNTVSSNSASWTGSTGGGVVTATGAASVFTGGFLPLTLVSSINGSAILPYGYSALSGNSANWNNTMNTVSANSASWGQGGVDSAEVSAIASSYAESAVSSKQDSSAMSAYALSSNVSGVIDTVSANSAIWGQGGVDSATVSAIASAYQVVSSTASGSGEIFGQTAYYATEINGLTLSAQEAALATYATNAGSAGAAPTNSSDVSAIASGYASGKADSSALSSYALSADVSSTIDTVSSNSASWGGGGIDSATCSAIASSYAESAASSKQDSSGMTAYMFSSAMQVVANSSQATATGVLYILTGGA